MTVRGIAAALAAVAAGLGLNRHIVGRETRPALAGAGRLVPTPVGDIHVVEDGDAGGPPIVLIHGFAGSLHWFDRLAPLLAEGHRVVRLDLLGHGGSAKPAAGYTVEEHAEAVTSVLGQLGVDRASFVGHSFGAAIAVAVAQREPSLVERMALLDEGPDNGFGDQPLTTTLGFVPVLGELMHTLSFDAAIRDGYRDAFAKDFDLASGFDEPDQVVRDYRDMTYPSYAGCWQGEERFLSEQRLDDRLRGTGIPALVVFGEEDRFFHAHESADAFRRVPGARVEVLPGVGHSPNVERPGELARLILDSAAVPSG